MGVMFLLPIELISLLMESMHFMSYLLLGMHRGEKTYVNM